ncbi:hypothetical protein OGAPHI_000022 [Ogataea philodendri]|uniref:Uncharacterized protein n=1 Tax=Ogataea philodendri TaxID=1378263 RepID=A0A9P8TAG1_9ASCO|nr:uncharacterized protein OGAPHI_000022 [Ogataea philodendri]KAH3671836.1 hypothetical protein OGAPHI_000022 [Ogataea philodendri]
MSAVGKVQVLMDNISFGLVSKVRKRFSVDDGGVQVIQPPNMETPRSCSPSAVRRLSKLSEPLVGARIIQRRVTSPARMEKSSSNSSQSTKTLTSKRGSFRAKKEPLPNKLRDPEISMPRALHELHPVPSNVSEQSSIANTTESVAARFHIVFDDHLIPGME